MRRFFLLVLLVALAGCGGKKSVNSDKSLVHAGGTQIISNVASIRPEIASSDTDMADMSKGDFKVWMEEHPDAIIDRAIYFDDFKLDLGSQTVSSYGQFDSLRKDLEKKMGEINSFLKGSKRQLDVKDW